MKILVLGGYGLIGSAVVRRLLHENYNVTGLGRSAEQGHRLLPDAHWISAEINHLDEPSKWSVHLQDIDVVINASGALQSGTRDNLQKVQKDSIVSLIKCCERLDVKRFIQISAPGASVSATTEFLTTKGAADDALRTSILDWVILKPGLVLSSTSTGGTNLLRMLSAFPIVQPMVLGESRIQTVDINDVTSAVFRCIDDPALSRQEFDLVESSDNSLSTIITEYRAWLGFPKSIATIKIPLWVVHSLSRFADLTSYLGWRSPLRSTAIKVLEENVIGDPLPWMKVTGTTLNNLSTTLLHHPSTRQDRAFARLQLWLPVALLLYSLFWITSGVIGLFQIDTAVSVISSQLSARVSTAAVVLGSVLDISVGFGLLVQKYYRLSCHAAIGLSLSYLFLGSVLTPGLWLDPLGPLVKVIPVILVSIFLLAMADER